MTPGRFPEKTITLRRPEGMLEEDCGSLDVFQEPARGTTLSVWTMSWRERIAALVFGKVWVWVHAGGTTQPPIALSAERSPFRPPPGPAEAGLYFLDEAGGVPVGVVEAVERIHKERTDAEVDWMDESSIRDFHDDRGDV